MPYKRKRGSKIQWVGQIRIGDRRETRVFETKKKAKEWESERREELTNPEPAAEVKQSEETILSTSCHEWATQYLIFCVRKYVPKVVSEKRSVFSRFNKAIGPDEDASKLSLKQILAYVENQVRSGHAINKDLKNLQAAYNWGIKYLGLKAPNPFALIDRLPEDRVDRYVPPESEFWKVFERAKGQDKVLLLFFLHTAARRGEVYRLKWTDIDFWSRKIRLGTRKNKDSSMEYVWIPMTEILAETMEKHKKTALSSEHVFVQPSGRRKGQPYTENRGFPQDLCEKAKVKPFGCHAIRHLTASILAQNNVPMKVIQEILRHKKLSTTEGYVRGLESVRPHLELLKGGLEKKAVQKPSKKKKASGGDH
jgi:integrase